MPFLKALVLTGLLAVPSAAAPAWATRDAIAQPARTAAPDSLSATEFGALVQRLSAPGGYFDTDNLISNEGSYLHPLTLFDRLRAVSYTHLTLPTKRIV